jgi:hypothetical protein
MTADRTRTRVFVSYSHDSPTHRARVLTLANRLRADGVDARLDRYVKGSPPGGWPVWMHDEIEAAEYVLVICTEPYYRRALGREEPGRGLGASWEGAIVTQSLYEAQGRSTKFVPVVFDPADAQFIPVFLRGVTRYDMSTEEGYDALHGHLTGQYETPMPPLGPIRQRPAAKGGVDGARPGAAAARGASSAAGRRNEHSGRATSTDAQPTADLRAHGGAEAPESTGEQTPLSALDPVALLLPNGTLAVYGATRVSAAANLTMTLRAERPTDAAQLRALHGGVAGGNVGRTAVIGVAYASTAAWARVTEVRHDVAGGQELWHLTLQPEPLGAGVMDEMATTGYSADDIAILRARRILLDEPLPGRPTFLPRNSVARGGQDALLDLLIRGQGKLAVDRSPLPAMYASWGDDHASFLQAARLAAVLWLTLTNVVEHVESLDLAFTSDDALSVRFRGTRQRVYTNQDPATISVTGTCALERSESP